MFSIIFPALTIAGPNQTGLLEASAFRIDADRGKLIIRAFAPDGKCFEQVEITPDGNMKESISLPRFKNRRPAGADPLSGGDR